MNQSKESAGNPYFDFFQKAIHRLPVTSAIIDEDGTILSTNEEWNRFGLGNGLKDVSKIDAGVNYLEVCRQSGTPAERALTGIGDVLAGRREHFYLKYPCHSPEEERWFLLKAVGLKGKLRGAALFHINISDKVKTLPDIAPYTETEEATPEVEKCETLLEEINQQIRTPLAVILAFTETLEQELDGMPESVLSAELQPILDRARELADMVKRLLDRHHFNH